MGILDTLREAGNRGSPDIPKGGGYSKSDIALADRMSKRMSEIEKLVKASNKSWEKMSAARALEKAQKSMKAFLETQKNMKKRLSEGNVEMDERIKLYGEMADARQDAIKDTKAYNTQLNESKGMAGRLQNVMNEMPGSMSLFTAAIRDAGIVLGDMNQGFNIMARSGQVANKGMGELAASTGNYMAQMRLSSIQAAQFGVTADESNAAFAKLTETYGGVGEKVDEMSKKWSGMAAMATLSGLGMVDIANLADQGYKKLGETLDDTLNTVKDMVVVTGELNSRFGEGSVNSKAFASAIQEMAYGASFMNQNSRMLTETLGRELQMQLALGKAPEAALKAAQKNMELAGKVNIVGVMQFRDGMQAEYDALESDAARTAHLENLAKELGSEGEIIANMLKQGNLMSSDSLFAFQKAVQNSSKLSAIMLDSMRSSAAGGDVGALLAKGLSIQDAQYMVAEANLLTEKLKGLAGDKGNEQASKLFGKNWKDDKESVAMVEAARAKGANMTDLHRQFRKMGGAGSEKAKKLLAAETKKGGKEGWEVWADKNKAAAWMGGITNSFATISGLLTTLPVSLAGVLAVLLARKGLGARLANMAMPGSGGGGAAKAGRGMMGRGLGRMAGGMAGPGLGKLAMRTGLYGAVAAGIGLVAVGMFNASEILGKADVTGVERLAAGFGNLISAVTGADARDVAMGDTAVHRAIFSAMGGDWFADKFAGLYSDAGDATGVNLGETSTEELYAAHKQKRGDEAMSEEDYKQFTSQRELRSTRIASGEKGLKQLTVSDYMAESSIDGNGDLILRVPDFRKEVAQANLDNIVETN